VLRASLRPQLTLWLGLADPNYSSHLPAYEDGKDREFRNVGIQNSDAAELPKRKHTTFRTRRKFKNKNYIKRLAYKWRLVAVLSPRRPGFDTRTVSEEIRTALPLPLNSLRTQSQHISTLQLSAFRGARPTM
jgi:hypothetical protein